VEGRVTLNGKPLAGAVVTFEPGKHHGSSGVTNELGFYFLQFREGLPGAAAGGHVVTITTHRRANKDQNLAEVPELVPAIYNEQSTLKVEVAKLPANEHNFELLTTSKPPGKSKSSKDH
jgi:hypothetical protein